MIDEDATIEIIAPVLKRGKYKWKGIYKQKPIDFYMKDRDFKESVINQQVEFKNGIYINCILETGRKIDELGIEKITGYAVNLVIAYNINEVTIETRQGKRHKSRTSSEGQLGLFDK